jgi:mRNA-degrading endonuclease RelE of RelBE toxin-antitoxin system
LLVFGRIRELLVADNPKALPNVKKIIDADDEWRARQGDYRIFFNHTSEKVTHEKHEYDGTILILRVLHRSEAYKK